MMIEARGLSRTFGRKDDKVEAVRGVDLDVAEGEIVGFLGPNGAGKTTTLRMLTTLLEPTSGSATVAGCDLAKDPVGVRRRIGYVPQSGTTYPEALAGEELVTHARMYGIAADVARQRGHELMEQFELDGVWNRKCRTLSGGQRRRLDIAMGLIHQPGLIFLDEPTTGLDPQARANLWVHIRNLRDVLGATVFITTHYLDEADALCDRILVIDYGEIVARGTPDELKQQVSGDTVELTMADAAAVATAVNYASSIPDADEPETDGTTIRFHVPHGGEVLPVILRDLDSAGADPVAVGVHRPTLDDVFLTLTGRSLREEQAA